MGDHPDPFGSMADEAADLAIAIPARDEAGRIGAAINAIGVAATRLPSPPALVLLADDCTDGTAEAAREASARHGLAMCLLRAEPAGMRHGAGRARRIAVACARGMTRAGGTVLTTDADARIEPGALVAALRAVGEGADLVCGDIDAPLPPDLACAPSIRRLRAATEPYAALLHEVRHAIDVLHGRQPVHARPHYGEYGACMAVTARLLDRLGGVPDRPTGEDRALVRAAEAVGARIRYCDALRAQVSSRTDGRAKGGMADALRAALAEPDPPADPKLLPAREIARLWRAARSGPAAPPLPEAHPPLRASALERDLPALASFVARETRPALAAHAPEHAGREAT